MGQGIEGSKPNVNLHEEATRVLAGQVSAVYDSDEFALGTGVTNQSLKNRGGSTLFVNVPIAHHVSFRADTNVTLRFNATTNPPITIDAGVPFDLHNLEVRDIFISTGAVASNPMRCILF